ncbi:hypothetical protein [Piscirickettsia litoralis]|uniref:Uncharacterized protein n=1 Tax=Piscirickettsia litoralis TaxID=1891921 RepID=A0ABX3A4Z9_9GAMM|nr:hypothetical protein [Piscirickettsia litoralis]ODN42485.1 hypothetical protein BGC07_05525 [Piscirickettsia litoralis]
MNKPLDLDKAYSFIAEITDISDDEEIEEDGGDFIPKNDIFLNIPLEDRIESIYYDYGTSCLEDCLIDYKQIKSAVNKLVILNDMQKSKANKITDNILERLSNVTAYEFYENQQDINFAIDRIVQDR